MSAPRHVQDVADGHGRKSNDRRGGLAYAEDVGHNVRSCDWFARVILSGRPRCGNFLLESFLESPRFLFCLEFLLLRRYRLRFRGPHAVFLVVEIESGLAEVLAGNGEPFAVAHSFLAREKVIRYAVLNLGLFAEDVCERFREGLHDFLVGHSLGERIVGAHRLEEVATLGELLLRLDGFNGSAVHLIAHELLQVLDILDTLKSVVNAREVVPLGKFSHHFVVNLDSHWSLTSCRAIRPAWGRSCIPCRSLQTP